MKRFFLFLALCASCSGAVVTPMPVYRNAVTTNQALGPVVFPLQLPNWTGTPNSAHPTILRTNWNGYKFWMAYTPYPPGTSGTSGDTWRRGAENPTILASQDGINWVEPAGLVNPIATSYEDPLYSYDPSAPNNGDSGGHLSDPELWMQDASTMICLYRANAGVNPVNSTTSITIGTGAKAFTITAGLGGFEAGKMCRVYSQANQNNYMEGIIASYVGTTITVTVGTTGGSGTFADWKVSTDNVYLLKKTSTDGVTWSAATRVMTNVGGGSLLAPQLVKLASGTTRMFYASGGGAAFRDAGDDTLLTWGAETTCSGSIAAWHLDVQRRTGNELWAIYGTSGGLDPYANLNLSISSDNGASWSLISSSIMPRSGARFDYFGYYKPEFYFNGDGTINLYSDTGSPGSGSARAGEVLSGHFSESFNPFSASDAWKIGLWQNLAVATNVVFATNGIAPGTSVPVQMVWNPGKTNWEFQAHGDGYVSRLTSRTLKADEIVSSREYRFMGSLTNALTMKVTSGDTTGGTLRFTTTNTSSSYLSFIFGGDTISGTPKDRGFGFLLASIYSPRAYLAWGNQMSTGTDTTAELQIGADFGSEPLNIFDIKANTTLFSGDVGVNTAGKGLQVKEGSNAKMGLATLTAGSVVVSTTAVTANSRIFLTEQATGGTPGFVRVSARTAGTSFTITSSSGADTSTVAWMIVEPL